MNILKTVLSAGLGLGLSLSGVEVLAAEESRSKASKPSVMKNLFSFKDKKYRPNMSFSGFYGQNDSSYGSLDMLYPIHQKNDRLVFVDLRGLLKKSPVKEFNVGGGYRWLSSDKQKLYGAYGFFDRKMSENNNWFNQLTIGGELKTEQLKVLGLNTKGLSIGGNVYLPVGTKSHEVARRLHAQAKPYQGDKFIIDFGEEIDTEYALTGIDFEVGHAIPKVKGLKGYLGGYYFSHSKVDKVMGPRATLAYDLSSLMPSKLALIDHLELETSIQHDKPRGTTWYAGFRLQMQLGSSNDKPKLKGLEKQLTAFVRRDLDVVDQEGTAFDNQGTWTKETGDPYVGKIVSTEAELKELAQGKAKDAGAVDIIGVRGVIEVTGNDLLVDGVNTKAAVLLNYGQSITGQGLTFTANDGREYTVKIVNSDQGIAGADPTLVGDAGRGGLSLQLADGNPVGHLLQVYTDPDATTADRSRLEARVQRIEDLVLRVKENNEDGVTADLVDGLVSSVITNMTGIMDGEGNLDSFGHVVIDHIEANSNVFMVIDETGKTGKLRLTASKFTVSEMADGFGGMAHIVSSGENDLVIESIDNNELVSMTSVGEANGLYFDYLNGPVVNNRFGTIRSGDGENDDASGVYVDENLSGSVSGNRFSSIVATDDAYGVYVEDNIESGGSVSGNTFSSIVSKTNEAYGVYVDENLSGSVSSNTFSSIVATDDARGVYVGENLSGSVSSNTFSSIVASGTGSARGVHVGDNIESGGSVSGNTFSLIEASGTGSARGVYVGDNIESGGSVSGNTFSSIEATAGTAYGVYVGDNIESGGRVSGNTFSSIFATNANAFGVYVGDNIESGGSVSNNTFASIKGGLDDDAYAYGVYVDDNLSGSITDNVFTRIHATEGARGVYVADNIESGGSVSGNMFSSIEATDGNARGVYVDDNLSGSITDNVFTRIHATGGDAIGIYQAVGGKTINIAGISGNTFNATAGGGNTAYGLSYDGANPTLNGTTAAFKTSQNNKFGGDVTEQNEVQARN